jgi:hypothetical protein
MSKNLLGSDFILDLGRKISPDQLGSRGLAVVLEQREKGACHRMFSGRAPYLFITFINLN